MEYVEQLTDEDLARSAKDLPLKVIRGLGHQLHRHLNTGGNWEILAEELAYECEDIKRLNATANIQQEVTPGELLLRDWVAQPSSGHTLFVLHNALCNIDRYDCAEYMAREVFKNVIYMDLMVCVKGEDYEGSTKHLTVRTRSNTTVLASLQNILRQPVQMNYKLLDLGASWTRTLAKEYKGRQLMIQSTTMASSMVVDQDPTIDSSSMGDSFVTSERKQPWMQQDTVPNLQRDQTQTFETNQTRHQVQFNPEPRQSMLSQNQSGNVFPQAYTVVSGKTTPQFTVGGGKTTPQFTVGHFRKSVSLDVSMDSLKSGVIVHRKPGDNQRQNSVPLHESESKRNLHCSSCQCQESKQNNLNMEASHSPEFLQRDPSWNSVTCQDLNICEIDYKIDNTERIHRDEISGICKRQTEQAQSFLHLGETATEPEVSKKDSSFFTNEEMVTDVEYRENFGGDLDDCEYKDPADFENFKQETSGMDTTVSCPDRNMPSPNYSLTYKKQVSIFEDENSSVATGSSGSDKEFVSMKFAPVPINRDNNAQMCEIQNTRNSLLQEVEDDDDSFYEKERCRKEFLPTDDNHHHVRFDLNGSDRSLFCLDTESIEEKNVFKTQRLCIANRDTTSPPTNTQQYPYIDFNDFPQNSPEHTGAVLQDNDTMLKMEGNDNADIEDLRMDQRFKRQEHFQENLVFSGQNTSGRSGYESLQRHISCPADSRLYETSGLAVPTIADVFSPVGEGPGEFSFKVQQDKSWDNEEEICDRSMPRRDFIKRHSVPATMSDLPINTGVKSYRHTFAIGQKSELPISQLPECSSKTGKWEDVDMLNIPPPMPHRMSKVMSHPYKIVVGERPRKLSLDGTLANDRLFTFYNNKFRGELAWSALETEYTVERTMRDLVYQDGFYLLWYNRTKRNLMITVSNMGKNVHIRVHSKIMDNHLHFYILPGHVFKDVRELVHSYIQQGLMLNPSKSGTRPAEGRRLWMRCPVIVQYEKKPAISV